MPFDLSTAKPVSFGTFDLATAKLVAPEPAGAEAPPAWGAQDLLGGIEALLHTTSGMLGSGIAGLAGLSAAHAGFGAEDASDTTKSLQDFLTYKPQTRLGQNLSDVVGFLPGQLARGADWSGEKTTDLTGSPAAGAGVNTLIQGIVPALLGSRVGPAGEALAKAPGEAMREQILNAHEDNVSARAKDAGYKLPPTYVNSSLKNQVVEGLGGTKALGLDLSKHNQPLSTTLARKDIGLSDKAPLSVPMLDAVRAEAGKAHQAIADLGQPFHATEAYLDAIKDLDAEVAVARMEAPDIFKKTEGIEKLQAGLPKSYMSPVTALELVKKLRHDADLFDRGDHPTPERAALSKAHRRAASAVEDMMKQNLEETGHGQLFTDYTEARQLIAKTYDVQKALDPSTGQIDSAELGKLLDSGKLTGGLKLIAETARKFPGATKNPQQVHGGRVITPFDIGFPIRVPLRRLAASDWYQKHFVKPPERGMGPTHEAILQQLADPKLAAIVAAMQAANQPKPPDESGTR